MPPFDKYKMQNNEICTRNDIYKNNTKKEFSLHIFTQKMEYQDARIYKN
jgi:hypothetical protein